MTEKLICRTAFDIIFKLYKLLYISTQHEHNTIQSQYVIFTNLIIFNVSVEGTDSFVMETSDCQSVTVQVDEAWGKQA